MCPQDFVVKNVTVIVLDGPTMNEGEKKYSVYAGDNVTLICGTNLSSKPEPNITWTHPQAKSDASRYVKTNATLTINNVTENDGGIWKCTVKVNSNKSVACPDPNTSSRTRDVEIEVTVIGKLLIVLLLNKLTLVSCCPQFLQVNPWMSVWLQ